MKTALVNAEEAQKTTHIEALFMKERETKNAVRYEEVASEGNSDPFVATIGTLYVKKSAMKGGVPNALKVVIDAT